MRALAYAVVGLCCGALVGCGHTDSHDATKAPSSAITPARAATSGPAQPVRACRARDLRARHEIDGALGLTVDRVIFKLSADAEPCRLRGQPHVRLAVTPIGASRKRLVSQPLSPTAGQSAGSPPSRPFQRTLMPLSARLSSRRAVGFTPTSRQAASAGSRRSTVLNNQSHQGRQ